MKLATARAEQVKDSLSLGGVPSPSREAGGWGQLRFLLEPTIPDQHQLSSLLYTGIWDMT